MHSILKDFSSEALIRAIEGNLFEMLALSAHSPAAQLETTPGLVRLVTGVRYPMWNGIWNSQFTGENIDAEIETALAPFRERRLPMLWWLGPSTQPREMGQHLEAHHMLNAGRLHGMAIDLGNLSGNLSVPPGLEVEPVRDLAALDGYMYAWRKNTLMPRREAECTFRLFAELGFGTDRSFEHYVGWLDGEPIACCTMVVGAGVAGLFNLTTIPALRKQGFGSAVALSALRAAKRMGYRIGVLESTSEQIQLYRRLGFIEQCRVDAYAWTGKQR